MNKKGFTAIEFMVYIFTLAIVSGIIVSFVIQISDLNTYAHVTGETLDNTRRALDIITNEVRNATSIYTPTTFATHPGQLSLETSYGTLPLGETSTYIDFYLDDERLYLKREGSSPELITSERIKITNFSFTQLNANTPGISLSLTAVYDTVSSDIQSQSTITLNGTAIIRSY
jgi:hypothetical protein